MEKANYLLILLSLLVLTSTLKTEHKVDSNLPQDLVY